MSIYPIPVPSALKFRNTVGRNKSLESAEIDGNFAFLDTKIDKKLDSDDLTIQAILNLLDTQSTSSDNGLDVAYLRGLVPSDTGVSNIVARDGNGDFSAHHITAVKFMGEASSAKNAETAGKLENAVKINNVDFDGSKNIDIKDDTKLYKTGGTLTGKLNLATGSIPLNIPVLPTTPSSTAVGDVFVKNAGMFLNSNGSARQLAFLDSDIQGNAAGLSKILGVSDGGTGATDAAQARANIKAATRGVNDDITALTGLTVPMSTSQGGTGMKSAPHGAYLMSNGANWTARNFQDDVTLLSNQQINANLGNAVNNYITSNIHVASNGAEGFQVFAGGFTLNWGRFDIRNRGGSQQVFFKRPFPSAYFAAWTSVDSVANQQIGIIYGNNNGLIVQLGSSDSNRRGWWFAIGK